MPDRGGPGAIPTYVYENGPAGTTPIAPRARQDKPRRRLGWPRWPGWRLRLKRPHPARRTGDFLVFLAAADPRKIGSRPERYRYTTIGLLMLVTAAQAFYSATLFMSVGLGKSFRHELGFGAFFALAVFLIDRSIINFAAPIKLDKDGNLAPPKKTAWVLGIRVGIAIVAAILMSEMILLQVFKGDISEQIQNNHLAASQTADKQIEATYQQQIDVFQNQIASAQQTVGQRQADVRKAYNAMKCQEFGCPGITAGTGPGFAAAKSEFYAAQSRLAAAQAQLQAISKANLPQIKQLHKEEQQAIKNAQPAISNADRVLSQEKAFWQLTVKDGTVLVVRLLLSLLILGIDLAPILTKLTGRTSLHDIAAHSEDYRTREKIKHETGTAVYQSAKQADADRQVHDVTMQTLLIQARLEADVVRTKAQQKASVAQAEATAFGDAELYGIKLEASLRKHRYHHDYAAKKAALLGEPWDGGNGGWPGGGNGGSPGGGGPGGPGGGWPGGGNGGGAPPGPRAGRGPVMDPYEDPAPVAVFNAPVAEDVDGAPAGQAEAGPAPPRLEDLIPSPPAPREDFVSWPDPAVPAHSDDSSLIDELAEILFNPDESSGTLILDHRWILHDRLPGADVGGGGIVWRAKDRLGDARDWYVVKTVASGLVDRNTAEYIQQLGVRHEQRASMAGEHIGQILDHGDDRGFSYLVYPLYEPGSLARYAKWIGDQRTLGWCARVIYEVLSGLMTASAGNLVHLDIKPGNIVLDGDHARVIDWGLSRVWNATHPSTWIERGTPFYACPEQLIMPERRWETPAADLYGVGATCYWLLAGEAPLQHEALGGYDLKEYRQLLLDGVRPQPVHELVPGVPRALGTLIDQWLSYDPGRRVPPGTPAADALRVARDQLGALQPALPDMTVGKVTARRRRRSR